MELRIGNQTVTSSASPAGPVKTAEIEGTPSPSPTPTPAPATAKQEFITVTQPVTIKIPYGTTELHPGMKLPVISRDAQSVRVRYMNEVYAIPVSSTDPR